MFRHVLPVAPKQVLRRTICQRIVLRAVLGFLLAFADFTDKWWRER
jgi:hypothetical protein